MEIQIQAAGPEHFQALRRIELAAFETLRAAEAVRGAPAASSEQALQDYLGDNLLLAAFAGDRPVGFGGGRVVADALHICEMDVHPDWQRRGIGRRILAALLDEGRRRHLARATLTTDRWAPFNAPFYATLGFRLVEGADCPGWLADILRQELEHGLDPRRRVAMQIML